MRDVQCRRDWDRWHSFCHLLWKVVVLPQQERDAAMLLHKKAYLGEVSVSVWPQVLKGLGTK
jgi:hypothetical protein